MPGPEDLNDSLNVFEQQPGLNQLYTQMCFGFSISNASSHPAIINTLTEGLQRLSESFPWVAGQIVNEGASEGNTGLFKIKPLEKVPRLVVKDLRNDPSIPTMDEFRRANFPFSMLDESIIAPRKTLASSVDEYASEPTPIFLLQATFIIGGLLLTIVAQHQTMDMTGQGFIIDLFSKACRNEEFTSEELSSGNVARQNIIPLLHDSYQPGSDLDHQIMKSIPAQPISNETNLSAPPELPKSTWVYFTFSPSTLAALKSLASKFLPPSSAYVSTDDALTAFVWQSIIRARLPRLSPTTPSTLARAVDTRRYLDISLTYPGVVQQMTYHTYTLQNLIEEPLGSIASKLRSAVDPKTSTLGHDTRALATVLSRSPDKSIISVTATLDLSTDIMLSSWAKFDFYDLDFGLGLGKPEAVRRPQFVPVESLIYLMPKRLDGEISVAVCLRDEDLERLREDAEFVKYGTYIG